MKRARNGTCFVNLESAQNDPCPQNSYVPLSACMLNVRNSFTFSYLLSAA